VRALVREAGVVRLIDAPAPTVQRPDDVIVRVLVAGICRTDLQVADGRLACADPITLGHELCGRVIAAGGAAGVPLGALVTVDPRIDGFLGTTRHGAFAEQLVVPAANVLVLPELDPRAGAYVEPIAAALAVPAVLAPGARVGVAGDNRFAALVRRVLRAEGFAVADDGAPLDAGVETSATDDELAALCAALRPGGVLVLKSRTPVPVRLPIAAVVDKQLTIRGVTYGSFARAVELAGALELAPLFGEVFPLAGWQRAFARARADEGAKIFLRMDA